MSQIKTRYQCAKCGFWFAARAGCYKRHVGVCDGSYKPPSQKLTNCKYCNLDFQELSNSLKANHSRWCDLNPITSNTSKEFLAYASLAYARSKITPESRARAAAKNSKPRDPHWINPLKGRAGHKHSDETKKKMREKALASPHRRLRRKMIEYNGVWLDSTWEYELAKRLDELMIKWERPEPIKWTDVGGVVHNYFPDFYLIDYDLYLDPKNPQAIKVQQKKLEQLLEQHPNIRVIPTLEECKNFNI